MKNRITPLILASSATILLGGCATKMESDKNAPTGPPSATITVNEWQTAYDVSAITGKGTITYKGQTRPFKINSIGAGGTGAQNIEAVGKVFNLRSIDDFPGTYNGVRSGLTFFEGKMHEKLQGKNGVVIYLTGKTKGLSSSTGMDKATITFD